MMMNIENGKKVLEEEAKRSAEMNMSLLSEIAQKKAEIEEKEDYIFALKDLMEEAYEQKEVLEKECAELEAKYSKKKSIIETISRIFKTDNKEPNTSVETTNNTGDTMGFTQKVTSSLNKLRYDYRKGAITEEEFKEGVNSLLKESMNEELGE